MRGTLKAPIEHTSLSLNNMKQIRLLLRNRRPKHWLALTAVGLSFPPSSSRCRCPRGFTPQNPALGGGFSSCCPGVWGGKSCHQLLESGTVKAEPCSTLATSGPPWHSPATELFLGFLERRSQVLGGRSGTSIPAGHKGNLGPVYPGCHSR